uniref:Uncharacterized protein n=1 Tax=Anguilla anguilla TaxID=7936 RepID=A0A0E9SPV1_ANGAN
MVTCACFYFFKVCFGTIYCEGTDRRKLRVYIM